MADRVLTRILEEPQWVTVIRTLEPAVLARLIDHVGLEDAGEIVALATTDQLKRIFDEDLWRSDKPGQAETFDAERFGTWLSVLLETGTAFAADKLAELDEDFLAMAFAKQLYVIDIDSLATSMSSRRLGGGGLSEDDLIEKALESSLSHEFEGYLAISRDTYTWDAVLTALIALDEGDHELFTRLIERICHLSTETIDDNGGLHSVLTSDEQLDADVAGDRRDRRARKGFVDPQDARAFIKLAHGPLEEKDWITPKYFLELETAEQTARPLSANRTTGAEPESARERERFLHLLQEAEILPRDEAPLLLADASGTNDPYSSIREALRALGAEDPALLGRRMSELSYLSNTVIAGCAIEGRPFRPAEAADAVLAMCTLTLNGQSTDLKNADIVALFRRGMQLIHSRLNWPLRQRFVTELKRDDLDSLIDVLDQQELEELKGLLEDIPRMNGKFISSRMELEEAVRRSKALALKAAGPED